MSIPSYPRIWSFGGKVPLNPWDGKPAVIQEKVDGSQFSFGIIDDALHMRSKSQEQTAETFDKMFGRAIDAVLERSGQLPPDTVFRCEYLNKPKHNTLAYARVPVGNLAVFDVYQRDAQGLWDYLAPRSASIRAAEISLEFVPTWEAVVSTAAELLAMLDRESFLGGVQIEGVVMKRYDLLVPQFAAPLFCKYVSERFKEVHGADWKQRNPTGKDVMATLADQYRTEARWAKAVQHLRDQGALEGAPQDIGPIIAEVRRDVDEECRAEIADALYRHWNSTAGRSLTAGLPEWYKAQLLEETFA